MRYNSSFLILTLNSSPKYQNAFALVQGASKAEQLIWFSSFLRLLLFIILQCQGLMGAGKHPTVEGSQENSFFAGNLNLNENTKMIAAKPLR